MCLYRVVLPEDINHIIISNKCLSVFSVCIELCCVRVGRICERVDSVFCWL